jgi:hypothetical protein
MLRKALKKAGPKADKKSTVKPQQKTPTGIQPGLSLYPWY